MDLSWIFESIVNWVASIVTSIMDAVSGIFLDALGTDMTAMEQYFPFVTEAFSIFQYSAWALLFLITVWQLFRVFGGPVTEAENPWQLLIRSAIFALLIGYAKPIFLLALDIARAPYTALLDATMDPGSFTFAGVEQVIQNGLTTLVSTITVIGPLLTIILMVSLGWNYFKMLLECVERYVVVGVLCYISPLAFAMGGSKTTSNVFKGWTRMVGSQLLLLVLNVWFLRAFNSTVGQFVGSGGALSTGQGSIFLWMFVALAFLKTAQKFDAYLAAMGLNVAQTGSSMGMELLMAARVISGVASGGARTAGSIFRGASGAPGAGGAAAGGGFFAGFASRFKPNSYVRDAVVEGGTPMGAGGSIGLVARTFGGMAARNGATLSSESIASVAARPGNVAGTIAGGDRRSQCCQLYAAASRLLLKRHPNYWRTYFNHGNERGWENFRGRNVQHVAVRTPFYAPFHRYRPGWKPMVSNGCWRWRGQLLYPRCVCRGGRRRDAVTGSSLRCLWRFRCRGNDASHRRAPGGRRIGGQPSGLWHKHVVQQRHVSRAGRAPRYHSVHRWRRLVCDAATQ